MEKACIGKDDNITGEAFRTKETVEVFNIEQDDRLKYREELIQMGFKSLLAFPLLIKEEGIGTINLYTTYKHPFTKDEKDLLEIFARHAGIVIESSKLISKRGDIIKSVLEASFESYSLNALLDKIVRIGMKELDAKSCTIFLLEDDKETLRIKAGDGEIGKRLLEVNATYYVTQKETRSKTWRKEKNM